MQPRSRSDILGLTIILLVFTSLGAALRLFFVTQDNFPINDGGMFYQMTRDLQAAGFALPVFTTYNSGAYAAPIPFAYSPLGFYLAGILQSISGLSLLVIFQYLPAVYAILAIPVFYLLAHEILGPGFAALHSTLAYVALLPAYQWLIMGGGITRSPATLFSLLALWLSVRAFKRREWLAVGLAALCTGLVGLTHLEILWITAIWIALAALFLAPNRWGLLALAAIGAGSALVLAPWFMVIVGRHGLDTPLGALGSGFFSLGNSLANLLLRNLTDEVTFTPLLVFAMLAFVQRLLRRNYLLPAWVMAVAFLNPRSLTRSMAIPVAMLVGVAIDEIILPAFNRDGADEHRSRLAANLASTILIAFIVIRSAALAPIFMKNETVTLDVLSKENRRAMAWAEANTPADSRFLMLTPATNWATDQAAEWFPALAQRTSINTAQGSEWLSGTAFQRMTDLHAAIKDCTAQDLKCVAKVTQKYKVDFDYIYISGQLMDAGRSYFLPMPIETALRTSPAYRVVYQDGQVVVFERSK